MSVKAEIKLYIPFKTCNTISYRIKLIKDSAWEKETLYTGFYLGYVERIFSGDDVYGDCVILKKQLDMCGLQIGGRTITIAGARIFSFDTSVAFLELNVVPDCETADAVEDITSLLRLSNIRNITLPDGSVTCVNDICESIITGYGKTAMFDHLGKCAQTRPEHFVSLIADGYTPDTDMHLFKIANGFDSTYTGDCSDGKTYSNFPHIKWWITDRGMCNVGILTQNSNNNDFINNNWFAYTNTRYIVWYMLVLHQKYALYQYMNDIANKNSFGNLRDFQKKIMEFNTKYRFSIVSEESSYQNLYDILSQVKCLEREFNDIDGEVVRISEYNESVTDKNGTRAMMAVSFLCAVSAVKDFYEILSHESVISGFFNLSLYSRISFAVFILSVIVAFAMVIPKSFIKIGFNKIVKFFVKLSLKK